MGTANEYCKLTAEPIPLEEATEIDEWDWEDD